MNAYFHTLRLFFIPIDTPPALVYQPSDTSHLSG